MRYPDASDERLEVIRANECDAPMTLNLTTRRFQALWNEIERLRAHMALEIRRGDELFAENQLLRRTRPATVWMGDP